MEQDNVKKEDVSRQYRVYNPDYDAYYDCRDGRWLEKRCSDPKCDFCKDRPLFAQVTD